MAPQRFDSFLCQRQLSGFESPIAEKQIPTTPTLLVKKSGPRSQAGGLFVEIIIDAAMAVVIGHSIIDLPVSRDS